MADVSRGTMRARSWPRSRGSTLTPKTKDQMEWFRQANEATKYMDPKMFADCWQASQGSALLPRDLALMMWSGRMMAFYNLKGGISYPMPARSAVSESLDALGATPGMTLIRGPEYWETAIIPNAKAECRLSMSAAQTLSANVSTKLNFDTVITDPVGWYDPIGKRIIPSATGSYIVEGRMQTNGSGAGVVFIHRNSTRDYAVGPSILGSSADAVGGSAVVTIETVGDYLEVFGQRRSTGATRIEPDLTYFKVIGPI